MFVVECVQPCSRIGATLAVAAAVLLVFAPGIGAAQALSSTDGAAATASNRAALMPLALAERLALTSLPADAEPDEITRGTHYYVSNETNHQHFAQALATPGGVAIGVGADQNYLLAGWSKPELLVLFDFDQNIVDLHAIYRVAFLHAPTAEAFCALFSEQSRTAMGTLVRNAYANTGRPLAAASLFRQVRKVVEKRLALVSSHYQALGIPTFLSDPSQYQHLRDLYLTDRVVAVRGDLTGQHTLRALGARLAAQGRIVRWLYLSNAEQYFQYTQRFRLNLQSLPIDATSLVLRTRPFRRDYSYVVQSFENFRHWLSAPHIRNVRALVPRSTLESGQPLIQIAELPPPGRPQRARTTRRRSLGP